LQAEQQPLKDEIDSFIACAPAFVRFYAQVPAVRFIIGSTGDIRSVSEGGRAQHEGENTVLDSHGVSSSEMAPLQQLS